MAFFLRAFLSFIDSFIHSSVVSVLSCQPLASLPVSALLLF